MKTAYIKIIGEEREGDKALENTCKKLSEHFEIIANPENIKPDTTIYLIAHGNDTSRTAVVELGDKTPKQVAKIAADILKKAKLEAFEGKIILEGCHTAEPAISPKLGEWTKKVLSTSYKVKKSSFLVDFLEAFKDESKNLSIMPEAKVGGYLGAAFEGDYRKTGYGIAASENPLTINFQNKNRIKGEESNGGGIRYSEEESYLEVSLGQKVPFGQKHR